jgi:hypothetical protein
LGKEKKEKESKYTKEDIKVTTTLLVCLVTVMMCAVSLIGIYEEKSLLDIIQEVASGAESFITDGKSIP